VKTVELKVSDFNKVRNIGIFINNSAENRKNLRLCKHYLTISLSFLSAAMVEAGVCRFLGSSAAF
jgi:hypothetical protein